MSTTGEPTDRGPQTVAGRVYITGYGEGDYGEGRYGGARPVNNITDLRAALEDSVLDERGPTTDRLLESVASLLYRTDVFIDALYEDRFVDTATGAALERIGEAIGISRQTGESDRRYRARILAGYRAATSRGTFEDLGEVLLLTLDCSSDDVTLRTDAETPPGAALVETTDAVVADAPFDVAAAERLLTTAAPAGHRVSIVTGDSFQFATEEADDQTGEGFAEGRWT